MKTETVDVAINQINDLCRNIAFSAHFFEVKGDFADCGAAAMIEVIGCLQSAEAAMRRWKIERDRMERE